VIGRQSTDLSGEEKTDAQQFVSQKMLRIENNPSPGSCNDGVVCTYCVQELFAKIEVLDLLFFDN
jgi:hypothetical protein